MPRTALPSGGIRYIGHVHDERLPSPVLTLIVPATPPARADLARPSGWKTPPRQR
ncbi:hypothetical protein D187_010233 [Cystobacter fuscus DSM 2262]|uniref:Uncharacterized protein n=1 Tax=Cystobacter fuscus (strain ATCC 25194 / DSM 2262 / NBRC 100088 / M29) TaxID=1242864 RepID=S9QK41_CYSF2|nr:hypothetical protein D187_010233 [Cystobacter fuscus DSM 2262]